MKCKASAHATNARAIFSLRRWHTHSIHTHNAAHRTNDPILQHASGSKVPTPVATSTSTRRLRISKVIMQIRLCSTDWAWWVAQDCASGCATVMRSLLSIRHCRQAVQHWALAKHSAAPGKRGCCCFCITAISRVMSLLLCSIHRLWSAWLNWYQWSQFLSIQSAIHWPRALRCFNA